MPLHRRGLLLVTLVLLVLSAEPVAAVKWKECLERVTKECNDNKDYINDRTLFRPGSTPTEPLLTPYGCASLCGGPYVHLYPDWGSILNSWILPALVLLTQKAVRDGNGWSDTIHLLANPFDWFLRFMITIEEARQCLRWAEAVISYERRTYTSIAYEEVKKLWWNERLLNWVRWKHPKETELGRQRRFLGTYLQTLKTAAGTNVFDAAIIHQLFTETLSPQMQKRIEHDIAIDVASSRSGRLLLALIALVLYIWQVISAFDTTIGGAWSTVPGGRIALAIFWHWIVAAILLSNTVGSFPAKDFCRTTVEKVYARYGRDISAALNLIDQAKIEDVMELDELLAVSVGPPSQMPKAIALNSYTTRKINKYRRRRMVGLLVLAVVPVAAPIFNSLALLWYLPPTGPNCRFFLLLGISLVYIANATVSPFLSRYGRTNKRKDLAIALSSTSLIIWSSIGLFNTCACWSGLTRPEADKALYLNSDKAFDPLLRKAFPMIFIVCLVSQFVSFELMRWFGWEGISVLRWSKAAKKGRSWYTAA